MEAEADGKQAELRAKHLQKQLALQKKELATKEKESAKLLVGLAGERAAVDKLA